MGQLACSNTAIVHGCRIQSSKWGKLEQYIVPIHFTAVCYHCAYTCELHLEKSLAWDLGSPQNYINVFSPIDFDNRYDLKLNFEAWDAYKKVKILGTSQKFL
jgi:hypothetical protein